MRFNKLIIVFSGALLLSSCSKFSDCWSGSGVEMSRTETIAAFDTLVVDQVFDIKLVQDSLNYIEVSGREKFVESFKTEFDGHNLKLKADKMCQWMSPSEQKLTLAVHFTDFHRIITYEACRIFSEDTLFFDHEFGFVSRGKYNEADLIFKTNTLYYWNGGFNGGKVIFRGKANTLKLWNVSLGSVDASALITNDVYVKTSAKTDCYVYASNSIVAEIENSGNVYYKGHPSSTRYDKHTGSGLLIAY